MSYLFEGSTMKKPTQRATVLAIAIAALATVAGAQAQTTSANNSTNAYAMTGVPKIYFDLSAGQTDYRLGNGSGLFGSNNGSTAYAISAGSYFTNNVGVELGYTDFGRINRGGGETRADGVTLKLVGRLPLGPQFNLLGGFRHHRRKRQRFRCESGHWRGVFVHA
jgi:OmpA-OmpF porin, OOP family